MIMISGEAGVRLAKAKAELDKWKARGGKGDAYGRMLRKSLDYAADEVADELIAAGFADMEGDQPTSHLEYDKYARDRLASLHEKLRQDGETHGIYESMKPEAYKFACGFGVGSILVLIFYWFFM